MENCRQKAGRMLKIGMSNVHTQEQLFQALRAEQGFSDEWPRHLTKCKLNKYDFWNPILTHFSMPFPISILLPTAAQKMVIRLV